MEMSAEKHMATNPESLIKGLKEALFNDKAKASSEMDLYIAVTKERTRVVEAIQRNPKLTEGYPNIDKALNELKAFLEDKLIAAVGLTNFSAALEGKNPDGAKVEKAKEGWGRWALNKVKSTLGYAAKNPIKTTLIVAVLASFAYAAAIAGSAYMAGGIEAALAELGLSKLLAAFKASMSGGSIAGGSLPNTLGGAAGVAKVTPML